MPRPRLLPIAATFALLAATTLATAADTGQQAFATREQLRHCMATESELKSRAAAIEAADKAREQQVAEVAAENAALVAQRRQLEHDGHQDAAVRDFNAAASRHNVHVRALNKTTGEARPVAQAYKSDKATYNQACAGQAYRPEDVDAVTKERAKPASAP